MFSTSTCTTTRTSRFVDANFVVVHINVGHLDANLDLAEKYGVPLKNGVPALAVLSERGKLLYSQKNGEFEAMRRMESSSVDRVPGPLASRTPRLLRCRGQLLSL